MVRKEKLRPNVNVDGYIKKIYEKGHINLDVILDEAISICNSLTKSRLKLSKNIIFSTANPGGTSIEKSSLDTSKISLDPIYAASYTRKDRNKVLTYISSHELIHRHRGDISYYNVLMHTIASKVTTIEGGHWLDAMHKFDQTASDVIIDSILLHHPLTREGFYLTHLPEYQYDKGDISNFKELGFFDKITVSQKVMRRHVLARYAKEHSLASDDYYDYNSKFITQYHETLYKKLNLNQRIRYKNLFLHLKHSTKTRRISTAKVRRSTQDFCNSLNA